MTIYLTIAARCAFFALALSVQTPSEEQDGHHGYRDGVLAFAATLASLKSIEITWDLKENYSAHMANGKEEPAYVEKLHFRYCADATRYRLEMVIKSDTKPEKIFAAQIWVCDGNRCGSIDKASKQLLLQKIGTQSSDGYDIPFFAYLFPINGVNFDDRDVAVSAAYDSSRLYRLSDFGKEEFRENVLKACAGARRSDTDDGRLKRENIGENNPSGTRICRMCSFPDAPPEGFMKKKLIDEIRVVSDKGSRIIGSSTTTLSLGQAKLESGAVVCYPRRMVQEIERTHANSDSAHVISMEWDILDVTFDGKLDDDMFEIDATAADDIYDLDAKKFIR